MVSVVAIENLFDTFLFFEWASADKLGSLITLLAKLLEQ